MQLNKFKMLGAAAIMVAAGMNVAHAQAGYGSAVDDRMSNEDILLSSTKAYNAEQPNNKTIKAGKYGKVSNVDDRMSNEDILLTATKNSKSEKVTNKGDVLLKPNENPKTPVVASEPTPEIKPGDILLKAWQGTKNVATTVAEKGKESILAAKAKVDAENQKRQEENKVVRAEVPMPGQVTKEDVIKAKDKVLDGMSSFLGRLRSEPKQENENKVKPK